MGRLLFCSLALAALVRSEVLMGRATAQPALPGPMRVRESKPVTVKDAEFVVVAQTEWVPGKPWDWHDAQINSIVAPLDIQLRITNLSKSAALFPTVNAFGIKILTVDGKELKPRAAGNRTIVTRPVLIPAGASYSLWRRAELQWDEKAKASELVYYDGNGAHSRIGPLTPGRYKLVFWYAVVPDKRAGAKTGEAATWIGEAVTDEVIVEVAKETIRGVPLESGPPLVGSTEVVRIRESKPVTVKDAKFVVVAESNWKPGNGTVPIDIQLRITNLGKREMIFHTFDAFGLSMVDGDGKRIFPTGGRNAPIFTRPVVIPAGASYSIGTGTASHSFRRHAELRWDDKTKTSCLFYYDGTCWESAYGPLRPGRYQLEFWYGVSPNEPFARVWKKQHMKEDAPTTWLGGVRSHQVLIEVLER